MSNIIFNLEDISRAIYDELKCNKAFTLNEIDIVVKELSKVTNLFIDLDNSMRLIKKVMNLMNMYALSQIKEEYENLDTSDSFVRYCIDKGIYE